ncbi:MAG: 3-dehydroquinate synthase, partial [Verrucomicrobiales bacterium]|nr:3-dehydroquinate synthase [Verrucomicrobiales bacterium]
FAARADLPELVCPPVTLPGGEAAKNDWAHVEQVLTLIERHGIDRQSFVLALGGGAFLDVVGLAAALAHRGVRLVRLPSTTLAQCDSGVGVKNGVNAFGKKNFLGTFAPPWAVINDFQLLDSLPARDKRAGLVEAIKVALIRDAAFFAELEAAAVRLRMLESDALRRAIFRCAELHVEHIATSGDPFETGSARPLDFGHWAAHKLEALSGFALRHGEAVAIGLALDTIYSRRIGALDAAAAERVLSLLEAVGFELFTPHLPQDARAMRQMVAEGLEEFREHLGGPLTVTLLRGIGRGFEVHDIHLPTMLGALTELRERHERRLAQRPQCEAVQR